MLNQDQASVEIHEKMRKYFTPLSDHIIIEFVENLKTSGGVFLPSGSEETKAIAHPVITKGSRVEGIEIGDWVSLRPMNVDIFKMYNRKFAIIRDFDVLMKVDMGYIKDEADFKQLIKDNAKTLVN
jgi:co-chaperonin GroES (HSP10)